MGRSRDSRKNRSYTIDVSRTPLPGRNDNISPETASKLKVGEERTAVLAALINQRARPHHFYKVKLKQPGEYEVMVDPGNSDINPRVNILNRDKRRIEGGGGGNRGAVARVRVRTISKQNIFVDVSSLYSVERSGRRRARKPPARTVPD